MQEEVEDTREQQARRIARELIASGGMDGILGLLEIRDHQVPHLFTEVDELEGLDVSGRYPIAAIAERLLLKFETGRIGVIARGCDERHLIELEKKKSVDMSRLKLIGLACTIEEARECHCVRPYPREVQIGRSVGNVDYLDHEALSKLINMDIAERRRFWTDIFDRCIKCYGCRNVCPLCNCEDCRLEEARWVRVGEIPPEYPSFHLIRAFHMADKCVGCFACERACPMGIPVGKLHQLIKEDLKSVYGYQAGRDVEEKSPLLLAPGVETKGKGGRG
jgi:formate dehydrogenase (coenzyme F420) beta subunit